MGKNFPLITNLKEKPHLLEKTIQLIEKSFHYKAPNKFEIDFAPLIETANHANCFLLIDENENVMAHIGTKESSLSINNKKFPITMIGGIAVDEKIRGEGYFQTLFNDVLAEKRSDSTLLLLWSDLEKLYNKFGFHLCGEQYEVAQTKGVLKFEKKTYRDLSAADKKTIQKIYSNSFAQNYLTLNRSEKEWKQIEEIKSADIYLRKNGSDITDYFFMNKGQDLPGVIYEYGSTSDFIELIQDISTYGKVWMGKELTPTEQSQYQFLMTPGDLRLFTDFVLELTQKKVSIRNINLMKQEVFFDFNEELFSLEVPDFLRGLFGPGTFEELELKPFFISGLDSI